MDTNLSLGPRPRQSASDFPALPRCHSHNFNRIATGFAAALAFTVLLAATAHAQVAQSVMPLAEHTPHEVLNGIATRTGHYNPEQKLRLTLAIKPPHLAEEEEFLNELIDRNSPNFHQFLSPEEWIARFGPSAEDEQAVVDWATSVGFTVTHRFNHRLLVDVEAPSGVIEKALGVTINQYQLENEARFSNDRDPAIPAHLQGILFNVEGLNNIQREHSSRPGPLPVAADYAEGPAFAAGSHDEADATAPAPNRAAAAAAAERNDVSNYAIFDSNGYLSPGGMFNSQVYNFDGLDNLGHCCNPHNDSGGAPNVSDIAIAAFAGFNGSDIAGFQASFPYLAYNYGSWYIDGNICTNNPSACPSGETTQDLEYTIATANSFGSSNATGKVDVYMGANYNNSTFTDMYGFMLSQSTERVMTTSWSCTEIYGCSASTMDARHNIFNNMVGTGWTLIAASGDRGASDDCLHFSTAYPGTDYDVLAAGGTQLQMFNNGTWDYEHGWQGGFSSGSCGNNNGGSGGGVSSYYGKPAYQNYASSPWSGTSKRSTPDISLNALGIGQSLYINGNLTCCANGTSIVAPELAGFFAQENAYLNYIGHICGTGTSSCTPVGNPMGFFYTAGWTNDASHNPFYDMIGNYCNDNDVTAFYGLSYYCDQTGWDNVTGWGSANMMQLAWAINWQLIPANGTPYLTFSGPTTGKWYNSDQQISWTVHDYGGGTYPGTGIAGFTQGWDSMPPDSFSKPHGGANDTFYSGPEYPNFTNGCMTLVGNPTCPGGVSQGCHTAHVRGWNNQGWTTGEQTYGPVCYDTVAPTIAIATNPPTSGTVWVNKPVTVTITATDPGGSGASGIYKTYYAVNTTACYPGSLGACTVYTGPFTISALGQTYVYYWTQDNAGNTSAEPYQWISIGGTPTVRTWPTPSAITYGETLASSTLTGGAASVPGAFAWTAPTIVPHIGSQSRSVTFTPTDTTHFNTVIGYVTITVNKATPTVSPWPTASAITYGQTLGSSTLTGGTASVPGTFAWSAPAIVPHAGVQSRSVTFTPTDTTNYNSVIALVTITVNKATPSVSVWPTASTIPFGQTLGSSTLTGGTASVPGAFAWTVPSIVPHIGVQSRNVTFTPTDTTDYNTASGYVTITVIKGTPTVSTWPTASAITFGQTLAASTLTGGTASVPGTFAWSMPSIAPHAGVQSRNVTFTPTDTTDYNTVTSYVTITVNKATPTVSPWPTASTITFGQTLASSTLTGGAASVPGTFAWSVPSIVPHAGVQSRSVTFTPTDSTDYNTVIGYVTITVN